MSPTLTPGKTAPHDNESQEAAPPSSVETSVYSSAPASDSKSKRYRLISAISESQTSSVWLARDTLSGTKVAVKRLTSSTDDVARQRLSDEAQVSERVTHPGLVPVVDSWFEPGEAALVFPYVPGETLAQRLHETGPLGPRDAAAVALDLSDILAATHDAQLIHRDVKPGNVLLAKDGRTRLVDFGISASGDVEEGSLELTGSGMAIGTLPYMAPEQLTGGTPTPAVDVYALGIVLYEMLSGTRPYNGKSPSEQLQLQQTPPPSDSRAGGDHRAHPRGSRSDSRAAALRGAARPRATGVARRPDGYGGTHGGCRGGRSRGGRSHAGAGRGCGCGSRTGRDIDACWVISTG